MQCSRCSHEVPVGKESCMYCGATLEEAFSASVKEAPETKGKALCSQNVYENLDVVSVHPPSDTPAEDVSWQFSLAKSRRRTPMSQVMLFLIFFVSAVFMGFIVLLLS